jgi:glycosyltransferase involved in cell wall biosynthesis
MCDRVLSGVFVASNEHARLLQAAGLDRSQIYPVGLPFDLHDVQERAGTIPVGKDRSKRVLFSSRWDDEKQPLFFIEVAKLARDNETLKDFSFTVCTSAPKLRSNNPKLIQAAREAEAEGWIHIVSDASKQEYYILLKDSQVHFNCALQDWVSFTLLEASALSTPTVAPCFRSFPAELPASQLYKPWDTHDAVKAIANVVKDAGQNYRRWFDNVAKKHHYSLDSVIEILTRDE